MKELLYPRFLINILRITFGSFLKKYYNLHFIDNENIKNLKKPFVILINHCGFWDPFFVCTYLTQEIHFVTSDNIFRHPIFKFFMKLFGSIPKSKFIPDATTIKYIFKLVKENKSIGIFPEINRTWDGSTFRINPNIGKLIKKLNIEVIGAKIKGGYLSLPRWSTKKRYGKVIIEFNYLLKSEDIKGLNNENINQIIQNWINYNEDDFIKENNYKYTGKNLAQFLERVLFICPNCNSLETLFSYNNLFFCSNCGLSFIYEENGILNNNISKLKFNVIDKAIKNYIKFEEKYLKMKNLNINKNNNANSNNNIKNKIFDKFQNIKNKIINFKFLNLDKSNIECFNTVHKWNNWQINYLYNYLKENINNEIIYKEKEKVFVYKGYRLKRTKFLTEGYFYINSFYFLIKDKDENDLLNFPILQMEGINIQDKEILEFYFNNELYRFIFKNKRTSTYKWLLFILMIKKILIENSSDIFSNNLNFDKEKLEKIKNIKLSNKITKLNLDNIFNF